MIARETIRALTFQEVTEVIAKSDIIEFPVATVGMHIHLSPNDRDLLFGPDYTLKPQFERIKSV